MKCFQLWHYSIIFLTVIDCYIVARDADSDVLSVQDSMSKVILLEGGTEELVPECHFFARETAVGQPTRYMTLNLLMKESALTYADCFYVPSHAASAPSISRPGQITKEEEA